jgi:hypothetical protein
MVSQSSDRCDWCRRPFDTHFDARTKAPKPVPRKRKQPLWLVGLVCVAAVAFAFNSLGHLQSAPYAAQVSEQTSTTPSKSFVAAQNPVSGAVTANPVQPLSRETAAPPVPNMSTPPLTGGPNSLSSAFQAPVEAKPVAKLASVHMSTQVDGSGNETAVGTIVVVNQSPYQISDFTLSLIVNGVPTLLMPFEGSVNYPMALNRKVVPAHGNVQVSVMSLHGYQSPLNSVRMVKLEAHFEGNSQTSSDLIRLAPSG